MICRVTIGLPIEEEGEWNEGREKAQNNISFSLELNSN